MRTFERLAQGRENRAHPRELRSGGRTRVPRALRGWSCPVPCTALANERAPRSLPESARRLLDDAAARRPGLSAARTRARAGRTPRERAPRPAAARWARSAAG